MRYPTYEDTLKNVKDEEAKLTELLFDTLKYSLDYLQTEDRYGV